MNGQMVLGLSCFSRDNFRASIFHNASKDRFFEASKSVLTKALLLKHSLPFQGLPTVVTLNTWPDQVTLGEHKMTLKVPCLVFALDDAQQGRPRTLSVDVTVDHVERSTYRVVLVSRGSGCIVHLLAFHNWCREDDMSLLFPLQRGGKFVELTRPLFQHEKDQKAASSKKRDEKKRKAHEPPTFTECARP